MEGLEGRVSPQLHQMMTAMLLGFNDDMQLEIADDLLDFACQHIVHTTGCPTADALLVTCYGWIAEEQGFTLRVKSLESEIKKVMTTTDILFQQLMEMEGLRLVAYKDAAGVPTIGYGHTKGVRMGDRITEFWARELLREDISDAEWQVKELGVARTEGQLDALTSFVFNLGIEALERSTLLKVIRGGGSRRAITHEFKRWVYAGGQRLRGLERRREWEARRFFE